jgi:predicted DNA binding CopG/RHH family protein
VSERPLQYFSDEALARGREMTPEQTLRFLEDFRVLHGAPRASGSRLISLRVPEDLLAAFKTKAALEGGSYQARIKLLMRDWLDAGR